MTRAFARVATAFGIGLAVAVFPLLAANRCLADQSARPGQAPETCELRVDGELIETLFLVDRRGVPQEVNRPKGTVALPPGEYQVQRVTLEGGYAHYGGTRQGWFSLAPGGTHQLSVGAPLRSQLEVTRTGRVFRLNHQLVDREGRPYAFHGSGGRLDPPQFTVRRQERQIGSGTFEYG